ncbi:MAG: ParB/RepB/Spo0J family partition protein [Thermoguttaceae bacterium]
MQKVFPLSKIKPNPFRHMDRYPIQRDKVEALKESLRKTGFWENIVAREVDGEAQIAYGHHRLVALQEELGKKAKVPLVIKDLDDEAMLQMMARENMEEWRTSAVVEQETVRAVIEVYAAGRVALPGIPKDTKRTVIRYAPSFIQGDEASEGSNAPIRPPRLPSSLAGPTRRSTALSPPWSLSSNRSSRRNSSRGCRPNRLRPSPRRRGRRNGPTMLPPRPSPMRMRRRKRKSAASAKRPR